MEPESVAGCRLVGAMPFTPFHFGPGVLFKSLAPSRFSLATYVATQIAIDLESLYFLMQPHGEVHRAAHSLWGSALVGVLVAYATVFGVERWRGGTARRMPFVVGGLVGGLSHSLLDSIMHDDVRLLWPSMVLRGPTGLVTIAELHLLSYGCAAIGVVVLAARWVRRK